MTGTYRHMPYIASFTEEEMLWAAGKIDALQHMPGFPQKIEGVQAVIRGMLRIAHPSLVWNALHPGQVNLLGEDLERRDVYHPKIGAVKPLDWLVDTILERYKFFPSLADARELFCRYFPAADGQEAEGMEGDRG